MLKSFARSPALLITLPLLTLMATSHQAQAEIYKWRDNRGVIQYSDRPPVAAFTKITRNEMINALQTKDLCTVGPIQKVASSTRNASAFLSQINRTKWISPVSNATAATTNTTTSNKISNSVTNQYAPLIPKSVFNSGTRTVAVLGSTISPFFTAPKKNTLSQIAVGSIPTKPISSTVTAPVATAPSSPAPVVTAPATIPAPTQVATASPPPATTVVTNPASNLIQVGLMPAVDISKNIAPAVGYSTLRIEPSNATYGPGAGEFRIGCTVSHMSNDDPMVYPNQQGAAHHHTFFGNTSVNYKSNLMTLSSTGNSTCHGGIANRSAYWIPTMIDTSTNTPVVPDDTSFYYKAGAIDGATIVAPPKGLRMIAGNSKATTEAATYIHNYSCLPGPNSTRKDWPWHTGIPKGVNCEAGDTLIVQIPFPNCWDGKNLDSPNHQDHMAHSSFSSGRTPQTYCPATHPIALPAITMNVKYNITKASQTANWRLASDNYAKTLPGGYSLHADWVNGWDETVMAGIIKNCINAKRDGQSHLLCDGRTLF